MLLYILLYILCYYTVLTISWRQTKPMSCQKRKGKHGKFTKQVRLEQTKMHLIVSHLFFYIYLIIIFYILFFYSSIYYNIKYYISINLFIIMSVNFHVFLDRIHYRCEETRKERKRKTWKLEKTSSHNFKDPI